MGRDSRRHLSYLEFLEQTLGERRSLKEKAESRYAKVADELRTVRVLLEMAEDEYKKMGGVRLDELQDRRDELNKQIRELRSEVRRLEKLLEAKKFALQEAEQEVEPIRREIARLNKKTKPQREKIKELHQRWWRLSTELETVEQEVAIAKKNFEAAQREYWIALRGEKIKPLITLLGLGGLLLVILASLVWSAKQLPLYGFAFVIVGTSALFLVVVLTLLRQDEKLREESFIQLVKVIVKTFGIFRKSS